MPHPLKEASESTHVIWRRIGQPSDVTVKGATEAAQSAFKVD